MNVLSSKQVTVMLTFDVFILTYVAFFSHKLLYSKTKSKSASLSSSASQTTRSTNIRSLGLFLITRHRIIQIPPDRLIAPCSNGLASLKIQSELSFNEIQAYIFHHRLHASIWVIYDGLQCSPSIGKDARQINIRCYPCAGNYDILTWTYMYVVRHTTPVSSRLPRYNKKKTGMWLIILSYSRKL